MYDHRTVEQRWQAVWEKEQLFAISLEQPTRPFYCLDMFPYPSGAGLHVGHPEGYTATDIVSRYKRMKGFDVFHPMGWDSFGLPAENYAIKTGVHPSESTTKNITTFKRQIQSLGFSYDWNHELSTSSPEYYQWTQWLFLQLFKHNKAYKKEALANWCNKCHTVLANEQVIGGECERCQTVVVQKNLDQWFFKITDYAEELLDDLDQLDWSDSIKAMQRNWIGKQTGIDIAFKIKDSDDVLSVFTTHPETIYGTTFIVCSPEYVSLASLVTDEQREEVEVYRKVAQRKSELERTHLNKEKTGVFTGSYVIHPLTGEEIPVWVGDFILATVGTGAVMGVPAHDERDFDFAKHYKLPIQYVISSVEDEDESVFNQGVMINSDFLNGLDAQTEAREKIKGFLVEKSNGCLKTTYRLRDWLISRQRYWGTPIPIIHCKACGVVPVPDEQLPVELPRDVDFKPTGESPLTYSESFHDIACPVCGLEGDDVRREVDTIDTFVDSSWYFLRYLSPQDNKQAFDPELAAKWLPIDLYVGGAEHAVMHLLYARFFTKFLSEFDYLSLQREGEVITEPFFKLRNQGMILAEDGRKMSKSLGNVVNPDEVVEEFGADSLRLYEMFLGPLEDSKPWSTKNIQGVRRFLDRVHDSVLVSLEQEEQKDQDEALRALHRLIVKVTKDIEELHFNTAIAAFMSFIKEGYLSQLSYDSLIIFLTLLSPFAPHLTEELYSQFPAPEGLLSVQKWPVAHKELLQESMSDYMIQVNGKVRGSCTISVSHTNEELIEAARAVENVATYLEGKTLRRDPIIVPKRLINFVV